MQRASATAWPIRELNTPIVERWIGDSNAFPWIAEFGGPEAHRWRTLTVSAAHPYDRREGDRT
jgi:hypothetical protein